MSNYGREQLWDAATWLDLDQVVSEELKRVRVAQKVFHTEDAVSNDGTAPSWISVAPITTPREEGEVRFISPDRAASFVEISVPFRLTPVQADAEHTLHTARTLARAAAKDVALAEDGIIFHGEAAKGRAGVVTSGTLEKGLAELPGAPHARLDLAALRDDHARARALLDNVNKAITDLAGGGWPNPYALILGTGLYTVASSRLQSGSEETPIDRLRPMLRHFLLSGALNPGTGVLASLAGNPTTIYTAGEPCVAFTAIELGDNGTAYSFRVFERIQFAVRDASSIKVIA